MIKSVFKPKFFLLLFSIVVLPWQKAEAGKLVFNNTLEATGMTPVSTSASATVDAAPYTDPGFTDLALRNMVTLKVNPNHPVLVSAAEETMVKLNIQPYDIFGTPQSTFAVWLTVKYDPTTGALTYIDRQTAVFDTPWYNFKFTLNQVEVNGSIVPDLPLYLSIEGKIEIDRFYHFADVVGDELTIDDISAFDVDCDEEEIKDEIEFVWVPFPGTIQADEYQVEWTFVNDYENGVVTDTRPLSDLKFDFRNNSTRVTTKLSWYRIPLIFDRGYVVYRVRPMGYDPSAPNTLMAGSWSLPATGTMDDPALTANMHYYYVDHPHEGNKNWQVTTTFAEEGKKKEVISYFDGSLRNRQTVTRVNTDDNTIVGETIYDYQGRPAVTVLPVPVPPVECEEGHAPIKYYPDFNVLESSTAYSWQDFDVDIEEGCGVLAPPMDSTSGAALYYSENNPVKTAQQAYVPAAKGYPFSQVEYTNDNTGRIRKQGGVGPQFQLNGGHETGYLYGQPSQIQLDRMFGSEVGDAAHYKKNAVIDPNGQASVSYLDQEGRVVATALAGKEPDNLQALPSNHEGIEMTVDMFNENANGASLSNTINASNDGIEFHTELQVVYTSDFAFEYNIEIDTLVDTCFKENVCINCVYNLAIQVLDECGADLLETPINGLVGHFNLGGGGQLSFDVDCHSPSAYDSTFDFTLNLEPGMYTIVKKLTLNKAWRDSVVAAYLDTTYNHCVLTLQDFIDAAMANLDTTGCYIDCEACLESLGTRDDFVASGRGTAMQYDLLVEQCEAPCKSTSLCEATYLQMLADVSPQGQYGTFDFQSPIELNPYGHFLSVYNTANRLSWNVPLVASIFGRANFRNPQREINGVFYPFYFEEDGSLSKIPVVADGLGGYIPAVYSTDSIRVDTDGSLYIYPQCLANISDFTSVYFKSSWARSLVTFHPEYCYYQTCSQYEEKPTSTDVFTSEKFDDLLRTSTTFQQAITNGLIDPTTKLPTNWFMFSSTDPYDPFVTNGYGPYGAMLQNKYDQYVIFTGGMFTMVQQAAILARCNNPGTYPAGPCQDFGSDFVTGNPTLNTQISNQEWDYLRNFYLSAKQVVQNTRADQIALTECYAFNDCIGTGNNNNSAWRWEMYNTPNPGAYAYWYNTSPSAYNNLQQPCSYQSYYWYRYKQRRFLDEQNTPGADMGPMDIAYQHYLQTGECPVVTALTGVLDAMAADTLITDTTSWMDLQAYNNLYLAQSNYAPSEPMSHYNFTWMPDTSDGTNADTLHIHLISNNDTCMFHLDKTGSGIVNWNDIAGFSNLVAIPLTDPSEFTINAQVGNPIELVEISGYTTCYVLDECNFPLTCIPTQLATDLELLMLVLADLGKIDSTGVPLTDPPLSDVLTPVIYGQMGLTDPTGLTWNYSPTQNAFIIVDPANPNNQVKIEVNDVVDFSLVGGFTNFQSQDANYFTLDVYDTSGNMISTVHFAGIYTTGTDSMGLNLADCDQAEPLTCAQNPATKNEKALAQIVKELLMHKPFDANYAASMSPYYNGYFTGLLTDTITPLPNLYATTDTTEHWVIGLDSTCAIDLTHSYSSGLPRTFDSLIAVQGIFPYGNADVDDNRYYDFYLVGKFRVDGVLYSDTIFGTSCIGFQPCSPCVDTGLYPGMVINDTLDSIPNPLARYLPANAGMLKSGRMKLNQPLLNYLDYVAAVEKYNNTKGIRRNEEIVPMKLAAFQQEKWHMVSKRYITYLEKQTSKKEHAEGIKAFAETNGLATYAGFDRNRSLVENQWNNGLTVGAVTDITFPTGKEVLLQTPGSDMMLSTEGGGINYNYCYQRYLQYVQKYYEFQQVQLSDTGTCGDTFQVNTPLLHYNDFVNAFKLCCQANGGLDVYDEYLESFDSVDCPGLPDTLVGLCGDRGNLGQVPQCIYEHTVYLYTILQYNQSAYAVGHNHTLPFLYMDNVTFTNAGGCVCSKPYVYYLQDYLLLDSTDTTPLAVDFDHFEDCNEFPPSECDSLYEAYLEAIDEYNSWADTTSGATMVATVYTEEAFKTGFCYCAPGYIATLKNATDGLIPVNDQYLVNLAGNPGKICDSITSPPCTPNHPPIDTIPVIPFPNYQNPCVTYQLNTAVLTAGNAYQQYIDSLTTYIADKYTSHCLKALEDFTHTYTDREYHFTLYYYDQAGNLVKTVPPQGVNLLAITAPTDPLEVLCNEDRTYATQSVFTNHTMATRYEYNSLNQLVKQTMPDHDNMNIWQTRLPNGLDNNLTITSVQFINPSKGYLTGNLPGGYNGTRGLLYTTNDAGETWQRVNVTGTDFLKIQMIDSEYGYAVGTDGVAFITQDGASSWDVLSNYHTNTPDANTNYVFDDIVDLCFINQTQGIFATKRNGYVRVDPALAGAPSNSGYALITPVELTSSAQSTTVEYDDNLDNYFMTATDLDAVTGWPYNESFRLDDPSGATSTLIPTYTSHDIKSVRFIPGSNTEVFACGTDGSLLYSHDAGITWLYRPVSLTGTFHDLYFRDVNNGVALVEDNTGFGRIYATHDNGLNWTLLSDSLRDYNALSPYEVNGSGTKLVAVGQDGIVSRVLAVDGTAYGIIDLNTPSATTDLTACWGTVIDNKTWIYTGGNSNKLYRTVDAGAATVSWTDQDILSITGFKQIAAENMGNDPYNPTINGAILASDNQLYQFYKALNVDVITYGAIAVNTPGGGIPVTTGFNSIVVHDDLYALNNSTEAHIYTSDLLDNAAVAAVDYIVGTQNTNTGIDPVTAGNNICLNDAGNVLLTVGNGGRFEGGTLSGTTYTQRTTESSALVKALPVKAAAYSGSLVLTAGNNGQMMGYYYDAGTTQYYAKVLTTGFKNQLNEIEMPNVMAGYLVGNHGDLFGFSLSGTTITPVVIPTGVTVNLHDITYTDNDEVYVSGDNGVVLYSNDIAVPWNLAQVSAVSSDAIHAIEAIPGSSMAIAAGNNGHMRLCMGTNAMVNRTHYLFELNKVDFHDIANGYVVGDRFTIKRTANGAGTWATVTPGFTAGPPTDKLTDLSAVKTIRTNQAVVVGNNESIHHVNGSTANTGLLTASGKYFNDVDFDVASKGAAVGVNVGDGYFKALSFDTVTNTLSIDGSITITSGHLTGRRIKCLEAFYDKGASNPYRFAMFAEGANSFIYYNGTASSTVAVSGFSGSTVINDVYFHDKQAGYIVGENGRLLKNNSFLSSLGNFTPLDLDDQLNHQELTGDMDIKAIAFSSRYKGFMGGSYAGTVSGNNNQHDNYARTMRDESGYYSTYFYYDRLGRIVASQNTKQYNASPKRYSYSLYDALGRIAEAGEKTENETDPGVHHLQFANVFGAYVNHHLNPLTINDDSLLAWINDATGARTEVTHSYYDITVPALTSSLSGIITQENLRKRIATVTYEDEYDYDTTTYDHATHYTYDIHGNVDQLVQNNQKEATAGTGSVNWAEMEFKTISYDYDLISGKVNEVHYQEDSSDQFHHEYDYDGDNRITDVKTSVDKIHWDNDASYFYYAHGPLARTELGNDKIQGWDYAYTLQGWIKGVNSNLLTNEVDIGHDGFIGNNNPNQLFADDAAGYSLKYFEGDYHPVDFTNRWSMVTSRFEGDWTGSAFQAAHLDLYNGNINAMVTTLSDGNNVHPLGMTYHYDQLNRLVDATGYKDLDKFNVWPSSGPTDMYRNRFTYDANGNILTQQRYNRTETMIENLIYQYNIQGGQTQQNRLYHVNDGVGDVTGTDLDDQGTFYSTPGDMNTLNNYRYNEEGQLAKDVIEEIDTIIWSIGGKIKEIMRTNGSSYKNLRFDYDAMGNRIAKHIYDSNDSWEKTTYYVRDAQGNVMAVYDKYVEDEEIVMKLSEKYIYGNQRLGLTMAYAKVSTDNPDYVLYDHRLGEKQFELSNHLGNVLEVVGDMKFPEDLSDYDANDDGLNDGFDNNSQDGIVDVYTARLISSSDYSPFGVKLDGRDYVADEDYRYGFNGKEKDDETYGDSKAYDFDARMFDPRICRWLSVDPKSYKYPGYSPYHFGFDNPIITIDKNGEENIVVIGGMDVSGKDKYKFINTGLKKVEEHNNSEPKETTTIVLFTAGMTKEQRMEVYHAVMELGLDVNIVQVASGDQLSNYLNSKSISNKKLSDARKNDKVTDLTFFGHGYAGRGENLSTFEPGHGVYPSDSKEHDVLTWGAKQVEQLEPDAFDQVNCAIESCGSAEKNDKGESLVTRVGDKTNGTVSGWQGRSSYAKIYSWGHGQFGRPGAQIASDYPEAGEQYDKSGPSKKITYESKKNTTPTPIKP